MKMIFEEKNRQFASPIFFILIAFFLIICQPLFSQENDLPEQENTSQEEINSFWDRADIFIDLTPTIIINTESPTKSAPSPIVFPIAAGLSYNFNSFFAIEPAINFFWNYYQVYDGLVLPAEIENRTGLVLSLLLNVPATFSINLFQKSKIKFSSGPAFLFRIPLLAANVNEADSGWYGSAKNDLSYMTSWFYQNGRFFFLSAKASWLFTQQRKVAFGPEISAYVPIISIFTDKTINGFIVNAGLEIVF